MFMGLNLGETRYLSPMASVEQGNAYRIESWGDNDKPNGL
jgi:hypothetical protein